MTWHLGCSADAVTVVKTQGFLSRTVGRKLPTGTGSDADSDSQRAARLVLARDTGSFGRRTPSGMQGNQKASFHGRGSLKMAEGSRIIQTACA